MNKVNCWEFKECGRELGGVKIKELGVCPAAMEMRADSTNGGRNGGRACWAIAGTLCRGKAVGTFATKLSDCLKCDFFRTVVEEEKEKYEDARDIIAKLV